MSYDRHQMSREALARIKAGEGFIYVAYFRSSRHLRQHFIKVGFSLNPLKRVLHYLPGEGHSEPELLGFAPGSMKVEKALHRALRPYRAKPESCAQECYRLNVLEAPEMPRGLVWNEPQVILKRAA